MPASSKLIVEVKALLHHSLPVFLCNLSKLRLVDEAQTDEFHVTPRL
jgi:hypothetical protein